MAIMVKNGSDVVSFLKEQHQDIKALLERVITSQGRARTEAFNALRRTLAVHETAEEEIVHPVARRTLPNGDSVVAARLKEENEAKKALAALEKLDVDSAEFRTQFQRLSANVIAHAAAEETEEFAGLVTKLDASALDRMRKAAEFAESVAPTRPHAGIESATANLLVGPFAAMVDRTRDALSGKH